MRSAPRVFSTRTGPRGRAEIQRVGSGHANADLDARAAEEPGGGAFHARRETHPGIVALEGEDDGVRSPAGRLGFDRDDRLVVADDFEGPAVFPQADAEAHLDDEAAVRLDRQDLGEVRGRGRKAED